MRTCTKCGIQFPETPEYFHRHGSGLRPDCKQCRSKKHARDYETHRDRYLARNRAWKSANPEKVSEQSRRWVENHRVQRRATMRLWRVRNKIKTARYARTWRRKHREHVRDWEYSYRSQNRERIREQAAIIRAANRIRYRAYTAKRRAMVRSGGTFSSADIERQLTLQGGHCRWCSKPLNGRFEIDHVIPLRHGGSNMPENIVLACSSCNRRKSCSIPFLEWTPPHPLNLL